MKSELTRVREIAAVRQYSSSRDSIAGTATSYGKYDRGVRVQVQVESRIFSSPRLPDRLWAHPASYASYTMGNRGSFFWGKAAGE
jgi:hypothetical protein